MLKLANAIFLSGFLRLSLSVNSQKVVGLVCLFWLALLSVTKNIVTFLSHLWVFKIISCFNCVKEIGNPPSI